MFALDAEAGPLAWAKPGARPANVVNGMDVAAEEIDVGDCRSSARAEEEIFVVLDGSGTCILGEEEHALRDGHVLARPAGTRVAHALRGGVGGMTLLAYGTRDPNDACYYPRSGKISWRGVGVIGRIERLDYWDGERDFSPGGQ